MSLGDSLFVCTVLGRGRVLKKARRWNEHEPSEDCAGAPGTLTQPSATQEVRLCIQGSPCLCPTELRTGARQRQPQAQREPGGRNESVGKSLRQANALARRSKKCVHAHVRICAAEPQAQGEAEAEAVDVLHRAIHWRTAKAQWVLFVASDPASASRLQSLGLAKALRPLEALEAPEAPDRSPYFVLR